MDHLAEAQVITGLLTNDSSAFQRYEIVDRRAPRDGHRPRCLHLNATRVELRHASDFSWANPPAHVPACEPPLANRR
jgi:hypothetical protein